jgi:hypothetical protein
MVGNKIIMCKISLLLVFISLCLSCNRNIINFNEYIKNNMFIDFEIEENKIYILKNFEYKTRIIYSEGGTYITVFDEPYGNSLFKIKYKTKIIPIEILKNSDNLWTKIITKDIEILNLYGEKIKTKGINQGWIKSKYIELY